MIYNIANLLEQSATRYPKKEAFKCLDISISYQALDTKANQLSSCLMEKDLVRGDRVAILMNRCLDSAIAVYGILKSGGAFVAIDPFLPLERILVILNDCGIKHIITTSAQTRKIKLITQISNVVKHVIGLSEDLDGMNVSWESIFLRPLDNYVPQTILEHDLASILYTSGSTGMPKGIMHSHHGLLSLAKLEADLHQSNSSDIIGNFAPLHFDQSLFGYFSGPLVGATTVIFPDAYVKLPASLSALVAKEQITIWFSVPLILIQVLLHGNIDNHDFSTLRWVRFGGEVFPVKQLRQLMLKWPHAKFINSYGPSEVARCTYYILDKPPATDAPIPLGTVWKNTEYKILDTENKDVKIGESGELVIRTATMMIGYWNNKNLTEKSFFKVEMAPGYHHVYYRTGDLVYENTNNELMILGRIDRQIKLRGYRIELDEIEALLQKNELISEAAAIVVKKDKEIPELEAVIGLVAGAKINTNEIIEYCKLHLPYYMVPQTISIIHKFPRTGTGKIDRKKIIELIESQTL
ncbi:amino acid adenylation domain-containing protein [Gelidibacter salicanalis]|uniref:Amino acid adenylation domain-containing protein n=1 Tax=Gelidibacter salicanalis TaxID=291193 RepID=A0A5C7ACP8_9FLAO|nr:amino acid adenylation domain-containing protein [Gelidibacter salicanalis]TXE05977.1 amino acid adenylation domain-containing protein [Gelidibacter salicanalis]